MTDELKFYHITELHHFGAFDLPEITRCDILAVEGKVYDVYANLGEIYVTDYGEYWVDAALDTLGHLARMDRKVVKILRYEHHMYSTDDNRPRYYQNGFRARDIEYRIWGREKKCYENRYAYYNDVGSVEIYSVSGRGGIEDQIGVYHPVVEA